MTFQLGITAIKPEDAPPEDTIIALGRELIESTDVWRKAPDETPWHCRVSQHSKKDGTFDEFWSKLGVNKPENEKQFISSIKHVDQVKRISETQSIWTAYYTFPPPLSPRVFTVLQTIHLDSTTPRTGIIVSIPVDLSGDHELAKLERKGTKGRYVAAERILELDSGEVEWRMATAGTAGGMLPTFITESSMPKHIAADVTQFLEWFHTIRDNTATDT
ncbi:hypothetical protein V8B97DRAFT_1428375 [Scleroderma yunnanense]